MAGEWVVDPILRQRYSFERVTEEDGGDVLRVDMWVEPGGGVTPHVHHRMDERFHVLAGRAEFLSGRTWTEAGPGETAVVPPGTRHAYRNRGAEVAHIMCEARPPSSLEEFLTEAAELNASGRLTRHAVPKGPAGLLAGVALAHRHRDMVELHFPPLPPPFLQRFLLPPLARLAERRGYGPAELAPRRRAATAT
jgi:mannose-6-phosphate isomerase-like protein (cupin superfamily)